MSSPTSNDPMAKFSLIAGSTLIALTVLILLNFLVNTISKNTTRGDLDTEAIVNSHIAQVEANLAPIGEVATGDAAAGGGADSGGRSGEEVYKAVCSACHATGAANAPKLDDKPNWEARVANGFDTLLNHAINGKGAMPPRAGQNVPDNELKAAIVYMTKTAGFDLGVSLDKPAPAAPDAAAAEPAADAAAAEQAAAEEKAEPAANDAPATAAATATEQDSAGSSESAQAAAPAAAVESPEAPQAAQTPATPEQPAAPAATEDKPAQAGSANSHAAIDGEAIYKQTCFACHEMGVAGAPKIGDKALWEQRIAKGVDTLYESAIKGVIAPTGVMPPKGGNISLSDDEVKAAVDYMIDRSQ